MQLEAVALPRLGMGVVAQYLYWGQFSGMPLAWEPPARGTPKAVREPAHDFPGLDVFSWISGLPQLHLRQKLPKALCTSGLLLPRTELPCAEVLFSSVFVHL